MAQYLYTYKPLDLAVRSIRLLRLVHGSYHEDIQTEIFEAWLDELDCLMPYEALSYVWGSTSEGNMVPINIDGSVKRVTGNLREALRHLRDKHCDRILWVDAICIDQENDLEKGHQVKHMGRIYKQAERVVAWLGTSTKETDEAISEMNELVEQFWPFKYGQEDQGKEKSHVLDHQVGLIQLLCSPWFERVWILQEVANARVADMVCGNKSISGWKLALVTSHLLGYQVPTHCQAVLDILPGNARKHSWWSKKPDLYTLLKKFRHSSATDPRDKIFALLGLASDASQSEFLQADYTRDFTYVASRTTFFLLSWRFIYKRIP
ncbi:HET-domain-containing protein [Aulographum hederae CBS 113979]|uniref:HET-domain-containing protein n=1 Tax=Aulographum hederae CBS 113979 TaxID=1176131 RepID=A0A6G1H3U8_9PEZI|nr:HET-domain-containing protein [Aulographum hederae CBS 113979]